MVCTTCLTSRVSRAGNSVRFTGRMGETAIEVRPVDVATSRRERILETITVRTRVPGLSRLSATVRTAPDRQTGHLPFLALVPCAG